MTLESDEKKVEESVLEKKTTSIGFFYVIILILLVFGVWKFCNLYPRDEKINVQSQEEQMVIDKMIVAISKLILLPTDEKPAFYTVSDKEKLKSQDFFKDVENGDSLLVYMKYKKAILYRQQTNKIINVGPIIFNDDQKVLSTKESTGISSKIKIEYYNGTTIAGLGGKIEDKVRSTYTEYETVNITNATTKDYEETLVVDISGTHSQEVVALAEFLGGKVALLPDNEKIPNADILIIAGKE